MASILKKLFRRRKEPDNSTTLADLYQQSENKISIPGLSELPDEELAMLNKLLPWSAFIIDEKERIFGKAYSAEKRNEPQTLPDRRIVELDRRYGLKDKRVLEAGCFEGIHTAALANLGASVAAFDGRIENVIKTLVRCWALQAKAEVFFWNLEHTQPASVDIKCDIFHHMGVLYHLTNPIAHMQATLPSVGQALMLDTHIAPEGELVKACENGFDYRFYNFKESGRLPPFAGLGDHAKWLALEDLVAFIRLSGFNHIDVAEQRNERNGPRVLIYAHR